MRTCTAPRRLLQSSWRTGSRAPDDVRVAVSTKRLQGEGGGAARREPAPAGASPPEQRPLLHVDVVRDRSPLVAATVEPLAVADFWDLLDHRHLLARARCRYTRAPTLRRCPGSDTYPSPEVGRFADDIDLLDERAAQPNVRRIARPLSHAGVSAAGQSFSNDLVDDRRTRTCRGKSRNDPLSAWSSACARRELDQARRRSARPTHLREVGASIASSILAVPARTRLPRSAGYATCAKLAAPTRSSSPPFCSLSPSGRCWLIERRPAVARRPRELLRHGRGPPPESPRISSIATSHLAEAQRVSHRS